MPTAEGWNPDSPDAGENARELLEARAKALSEELRRDALTGVFSRAFLESYLPDLFDRSNRTQKPLSLLLIAVTNYRDIAANLGNSAADLMLTDVARAVERAAGAGDLIVRYGGAVFVVVMPGASESQASETGAHIEQACFSLRRRVANDQMSAVELASGFVTHGDNESFAFAEEFLATANSMLYSTVLPKATGEISRRRATAAH